MLSIHWYPILLRLAVLSDDCVLLALCTVISQAYNVENNNNSLFNSDKHFAELHEPEKKTIKSLHTPDSPQTLTCTTVKNRRGTLYR